MKQNDQDSPLSFSHHLLPQIICYVALGIVAIVTVFPFVMLVINSVKSNAEYTVNPLGIPHTFELSNYLAAWKGARLGLLAFNSAVVSAAAVTLTLVLSTLAAYGLSQFRFKGEKAVYFAIIIFVSIPIQTYIIPLYVIVVKLGLANTFWALILPYTATSLPLAVLLLRAGFDAVPAELFDAARIDGAGSFRIFRSVVLPLSTPVLSAVCIFTFVHSWNEFFLALIFIQDPQLFTLPLGLQVFIMNEYETQFPRLFATLVLSVAPVAIIYMALQRHFVTGLSSGAVKE